jgi:hypothetical protein
MLAAMHCECHSQLPEYLGFIYDQSIDMELTKASLIRMQTAPSLAFYAAVFRFYDKLDFAFVNAHVNVATSSLPMLMQTMEATMGNANRAKVKIIVAFSFFVSLSRRQEQYSLR